MRTTAEETAATNAQIVAMQSKGLTVRQIAKGLGVTPCAIYQRGVFKTRTSASVFCRELYVLEFDSGHIKVGSGVDASIRAKVHARSPLVAGARAKRLFSVACACNALSAEHDLIYGCTQIATARHRREWFEGLDFSAACQIALAAAKWPSPEPAATEGA